MAFATLDSSSAGSILAVHPDIIRMHILTRLDGPTLASAAATSSQLQTLSHEQKPWRDLTTATWPSADDPRVRQVISSFPSGYRSFFADSYPYPYVEHLVKYRPSITSLSPTGLISAVDLYYKGELIHSKVQEIETRTGWFMSSPFRVDILDTKGSIPTRLQYPGGDYDDWARHMEENLILNWILIDPTRKRAANVSSRSAVTAQRNWLTGYLDIRYSMVVTTAAGVAVEVAAVVACGAEEAWKEVDEEVGGEVHVRDVRLEVVDIEGKCLNGRDSLVILQGVMEGKRSRIGGGEKLKGKYKEYVGMRKQWRERQERRERTKDMCCMIIGFTLFIVFWGFVLLR